MTEQQSLIRFKGSDEKEMDFNITPLKSLSEKKKKFEFDLQKPHKAQNFNILVVTTGIGHHSIDFKKHDFANGSFLFIAKGQIQAFDFKPGNEGYLISFSEEFLSEVFKKTKPLSETWLFNYHFTQPKIQVKSVEQEHFFDITERIYKEFQSNDGFEGKEIIQSLLKLLILESERKKRLELSNPNKIDYSDLFFQYKNLCEKHFSVTRNVKHYAESMDISYKHLNNICKQCINKTAKQFIDDFIILESKRYLLSSEKSVREISEYTGFDEPTNFVKYFKKHTGSSPEKFRKNNSKA